MLYRSLRICSSVSNKELQNIESNFLQFRSDHQGGINRFWLVGWLVGLVGCFGVLLGKNHFRMIRLINFFHRPQTRSNG